MEFGQLGIPIDYSRSCVLQLPMSVIYVGVNTPSSPPPEKNSYGLNKDLNYL